MDDADQYLEERPQYAPIAPMSSVNGGSPGKSPNKGVAARNGAEEDAGTFTLKLSGDTYLNRLIAF